MRIAVAGLQHETNTFVDGVTPIEAFHAPGGWPKLCRGDEMSAVLGGTSVPMAGGLDTLTRAGADVVPLMWAMALPSGPVEDAAFVTLRDEILSRLRDAGPVDGVLIELHGAMVTTSQPDAEGALLDALRAVVGPTTPIVATLDLHANLTARMFAAADWLEIYRTYPHIDMVDTGARAAQRLLHLVSSGRKPAKARRPVPFLLPLIAQATESPPVARLYAEARADEVAEVAESVAIAMGFPYADIAECGPSICAYAWDEAAAMRTTDRHVALWQRYEDAFATPMLSPRAAVSTALSAQRTGQPLVLADVQDNPGGGGTQDTTGLLQALVDAHAHGAVMVHICDPEAAKAAHDAGQGAMIDVSVGATQSAHHGAPVQGPWRVVALADGAFTGEGPMYRGNAITLGPVALIERNGVRCIVAGKRMQASEPGLLRHLGLAPETTPILALKSSVHFRGAYQHIAAQIIHVAAPGDVPMDLTTLPYKHAARRVAGQNAPLQTLPTGDEP